MLPSTGCLSLNRFESNGIRDGQGFFSSLLVCCTPRLKARPCLDSMFVQNGVDIQASTVAEIIDGAHGFARGGDQVPALIPALALSASADQVPASGSSRDV